MWQIFAIIENPMRHLVVCVLQNPRITNPFDKFRMRNRMIFQSLNTFAVSLVLFSFGFFVASATAQETAPQPATEMHKTESNAVAQVLGYGVGTFSIGEELFRTDFSDASQWAIQVLSLIHISEPTRPY